ncbi:MAG: PKD domain-containing protein, partial [Bacteroidota bacterium]
MNLNQKIKPLAILLCLATMASCKKASETAVIEQPVINPISNFEFKVDPQDAFKYEFKDLSAKYKKLEWRFGDDSISTNPNPTHIFATTGKYMVELRTTSTTGNVSKKVAEVFINPENVVKINVEKSSVLNEVKFDTARVKLTLLP